MFGTRLSRHVTALGILGACSGGCADREIGGGGPPQGTLYDSSSVSIAESASAEWAVGGEWVIEPIPEVTIGTARFTTTESEVRSSDEIAAVLLHRVGPVDVLSGGRIVVTDLGAGRVMVFDSTGALQSRFVELGRGPGEVSRRRPSWSRSCSTVAGEPSR